MTDGKVTCVNGFVSQSDLELGFVKAYNMLLKHKEILIPRWKDTIETGNALERLRAKQFLDLSEQPELECYVPELAQMVIQMVIIKGIKKYEFTFMDGSRVTVCVYSGTLPKTGRAPKAFMIGTILIGWMLDHLRFLHFHSLP